MRYEIFPNHYTTHLPVLLRKATGAVRTAADSHLLEVDTHTQDEGGAESEREI